MAEPPFVTVLAAGQARRFGGGKIEAVCAGKQLGRWVLDAVAAAGLGPGTIVTPPGGVGFAAGWRQLVNPVPEDGLGSSLALAAQDARGRGVERLVVLLADMPLVSADYLRVLAAAPAPAAARYPDGAPGVPALFGAPQIASLAELTGDQGAGAVLRLMEGVTLLEPPAGMLRDVDTPADLAEVERVLTLSRGNDDPTGFRPAR
jgi:molybdenum cofactor cytidylyltransferase